MLSRDEMHLIRRAVHAEYAAIDRLIHCNHGTYQYLCSVGGNPIFSHRPVGLVIHEFQHVETHCGQTDYDVIDCNGESQSPPPSGRPEVQPV